MELKTCDIFLANIYSLFIFKIFLIIFQIQVIVIIKITSRKQGGLAYNSQPISVPFKFL